MSNIQLIIHMDVIGLDFDKLLTKFEEAIDEGMDDLADKIETTWHEKAAQQLHSSLQPYLAGLTVERTGGMIQANLRGFLPVAIEDGIEGYDMKPGLLGNAIAKVIPIGKSAGKTPALRTLTQNSAGWYHPGLQARRIHVQVENEIEDRLKEEVFDPIFSRVSI